jgi:hypothetical protein
MARFPSGMQRGLDDGSLARDLPRNGTRYGNGSRHDSVLENLFTLTPISHRCA